MELLRRDPTPLAKYIAENVERFTLLDVGCAGGIDAAWTNFGSRLRGWGFDPCIDEVARLSTGASHGFEFIPCFVVGSNKDPVLLIQDPTSRLSYNRTFQKRDGNQFELPPIQTPSGATRSLGRQPNLGTQAASAMSENRWHETKLAEDEAYLPTFLRERAIDDVDFVKIDVDGPDFEIAKSLEETFEATQVLGCAIEVNFFGSDDLDHHTFHNVDRYMRKCGFELFGLTMRSYSSAALPSPYQLTFPAQTMSGRPLQGDALYLRDFGWKLPRANSDDYSAAKIAKLAALFALFNLPDMAAETLLRFRSRLRQVIDVAEALDLAAAQAMPGLTYDEYVRLFDDDDPRFYGQLHAKEQERLDELEAATREREAIARDLEAATREREAIARDLEAATRHREVAERLADALGEQLESEQRVVSRLRQKLDWNERSLTQDLAVGSEGERDTNGAIRSRSWRGGCLCYGPYLTVPPGTYEVKVWFLGLRRTRSARKDALLEVVSGERILASRHLDVQTGHHCASLTFAAPHESSLTELEFRVSTGGGTKLHVLDVRLTLID